ncbi:O-methyltransferase [Streptomyces viridochromogenes]|uniref:O-methyltransferase n=1 Tax=Streptomyces viridochromogenes TaxID=1938 RepID=UPI0031DB4155
MGNSYRQIHYVMRPGKNVERKLMAEVVSRIAGLTTVSDMRYVGLGSVYFADFSTFHRRLGFREMHSIEDVSDPDIRQRFEFNRPYDTQLHFTHTNDALPSLDWDKPSFVWLDYDDVFGGWMLDDLNIITASACSPTIFAISVNVEPGESEGRFERFKQEVGVELLPDGVTKDASLGGPRMGNAVRDVINLAISGVLSDRNGVLSGDEVIQYRQLFNFRYRDGARMLTVGGLLHTVGASEKVERCDFEGLPFVCSGDETFEITVPKLTVREALHLDAQLPSGKPLQAPGVPPSEISAYARLYRYLPSFVDADL